MYQEIKTEKELGCDSRFVLPFCFLYITKWCHWYNSFQYYPTICA